MTEAIKGCMYPRCDGCPVADEYTQVQSSVAVGLQSERSVDETTAPEIARYALDRMGVHAYDDETQAVSAALLRHTQGECSNDTPDN